MTAFSLEATAALHDGLATYFKRRSREELTGRPACRPRTTIRLFCETSVATARRRACPL